MTEETQWIIGGKIAARRDLMEAMALARQHRAKVAQADREARERDAAARKVGASIRRQTELAIGCRPRRIALNSTGTRRLNRFEKRFGLAMLKRAIGAGGGVSSFHFKLTARGLGAPRRTGGRPYRRREIIGLLTYILRECAREEDDQGIESNISLDPDDLAAVLGSLEELELEAGRDNANVYMSLIVSLPAELTGPERKRLLADICRYLADHGLGYVGIQHKPDRDGDQRNFHAHIMFSWRPMALTPNGCAFSADTLGSLNTPEFVTAFRAHAAAAMNRAMQAAGHERRFTAEKTRAGPGSSVADKHGPGRKHRDRRAARIAAAQQERAVLAARHAALTSAIEAIQGWMRRIVPDRSAIMASLRERQAEILAGMAQEKAKPASPVVAQDRVPPEIAVSHAQPAEAGNGIVVTAPIAVTSVPDPIVAPTAVRTTGTIVTSDPKEAHHADRPVYAAALADVRRHFAAREPDHRRDGGKGQTEPLAGLRRLSTLGLADREHGPQVLLHGISPGQLGDAAQRVGAGDGVRRTRDGDHGAERAPGADALTDPMREAEVAEPNALGKPASTDPASGSAVEHARAAVRRRRKPGQSTKTAIQSSTYDLRSDGNSPTPSRDKSAVDATHAARTDSRRARSAINAGGSVTSGRPASNAPARQLNQEADRNSGSGSTNDIERRELLSVLAMRSPLPLKEVIVQRDGAAQPMLAIVSEHAIADDADLVARAVRYQFEPGFQQVFEHHYRQFIEQIRTAAIPGAASSVDLQRALNPDHEPRLAAALTAAAGSRRYEQALAELREEPDIVGYTTLIGRGGRDER